MIRTLLAVLAVLFLAGAAKADDNRPLTVSITREDAHGHYMVRWKIPANVDAALIPSLQFPPECSSAGPRRNWSDPWGHWREEGVECTGLMGRTVRIDWPGPNPGLATIVRIHSRGAKGAGEAAPPVTLVLPPGETGLHIPGEGEMRSENGIVQFLTLGFDHIWEGFDHLLFVTGLIVIARSWRRILVTITGFTLAHSVTLALASLDLVRLPTRAIEVTIALSIVFLAVEIAKGPRDTLTWRRPVAVAAAFGLLHGFGFAGVLREVGLPEQNFAAALFAFNLGIEIGQVMFAAMIFAALLLVRRFAPAGKSGLLKTTAAYGLGIVSSVWLFQRLLLA